MVTRLCLPMSYARLDRNQTAAKPKPCFAGDVCAPLVADMP